MNECEEEDNEEEDDEGTQYGPWLRENYIFKIEISRKK